MSDRPEKRHDDTKARNSIIIPIIDYAPSLSEKGITSILHLFFNLLQLNYSEQQVLIITINALEKSGIKLK